MFSRRLVPRITTLPSAVRPFTSTSAAHKTPALGDIEPEKAGVFDTRQKQFRERVVTAQRDREHKESQSASSDPNPNNSTSFTIGHGLGSLSNAGEAAKAKETHPAKHSGRLSSFIYGTEQGREMDREIERSFSQVLARGKYVHSIVFHEVKPDKVDEYVQLVGEWYPRMAGMEENHVHLVGSYRTEVGDCDTFGVCLL